MGDDSNGALYESLVGDTAVRFIKLLPGNADEQIRVEFVYDSLAAEPEPVYEATSYTWGSPTPTRIILCNGTNFELWQNAHDFLRQLRQPHEPRILWMDYICINQNNDAETRSQVSIMHIIYRKAQRVLVWLGVQDGTSSIAMEYIAQVDAPPLLGERIIHLCGGPFDAKSYAFDSDSQLREQDVIVHALTTLFSRPWFRRVWVQQEAALCENTVVLCGSAQVAIDRLLALAWYLMPRHSNGWPEPWTSAFYQHAEPCLIVLGGIHTNRVSHSSRPSLDADGTRTMIVPNSNVLARGGLYVSPVVLADLSSWCEATNARDKVYAFYDLERDVNSAKRASRPSKDYKKPWQVVFVENAKWMYKSSPIQTLALAGRSQQSCVSIPSWVPDVRSRIEHAFVPHEFWRAGGMAREPQIRFIGLPRAKPSDRPIRAYSYVDEDGKSRIVTREAMEVTAILLDKIVYRSPKLALTGTRLSSNMNQVSHKLSADLAFVEHNVTKYFTGESGIDAYAGTIIANTTHEDKLANEEYEREGFSEWQTWLHSGLPDPDPVYHVAACNAEPWTRNTFVITGHGLTCLAPAMAEAGDYIALLNGFRYPIALQKVGPTNDQYYELLGPSYVHRMMRGRAWGLIEEFKAKNIPGSENEVEEGVVLGLGSAEDAEEGVCDVFPFNPKSDYRNVKRVLGKQKVVLV